MDEDIASRVNRLVEEEHQLRAHAAGEPVDLDRLQRIEVFVSRRRFTPARSFVSTIHTLGLHSSADGGT